VATGRGSAECVARAPLPGGQHGLEEAQAILAALVLMVGESEGNAAFALADLLSRRALERPCETLVAWARRE
jgi:hypothetical protein